MLVQIYSNPLYHCSHYNVGPVSALRNLWMSIKFLSVGRFTSGAISKCGKNLKLAKIITGALTWALSCV